MGVDARTWLALSRVSNLPTVWMNVLTAAVLADEVPAAGEVVLLAVATSATYCGGMVLNDYFDREIDAREQPFRPIPAGRVPARVALRGAILLLVAGWGLLAFAPHPTALLPGAALVATVWAYDGLHKAHASSVLLMAAARALVYVVTAMALRGVVPPIVAGAAAVSFSWTVLVTVVARVENGRGTRWRFPVIPLMIAAMAVVDGIILAVLVNPLWIVIGVAMATLTRVAQTRVRGD